jgi:hypothetical protein
MLDQDIDQGRGTEEAGPNEEIRVMLGKLAVDYARVLYFNRPQVEQAENLLLQCAQQEIPALSF